MSESITPVLRRAWDKAGPVVESTLVRCLADFYDEATRLTSEGRQTLVGSARRA